MIQLFAGTVIFELVCGETHSEAQAKATDHGAISPIAHPRQKKPKFGDQFFLHDHSRLFRLSFGFMKNGDAH